MLDSSYMQPLAREWLVRTLVRVWLHLTRSNGIVCRDCGQEVQVEMLEAFTQTGCLNCGGVKLRAARDAG
jgi:Zn finger protein HypA/HybF involved in hydrogenase expression